MTITIPSKDKKRQQKLLIILGIIVIAILVVLYVGVWSKGSNQINISDIPQEATADDVNMGAAAQPIKKQLSSVVLEEKLKKVDLNIEFFNQTILPFLKLHGDLPIQKGITGRLNPFIP
jgi:predicted amino acid-binding ACT domain protein